MLSVLRTYKFLPLLLSTGMLLSTAGPLLQPVCAMSQTDGHEHGDHHSMSEPVHPSEQVSPCVHESQRVPRTPDIPCPSSDILQCCTLEAAPIIEEVLLPNQGRNDLRSILNFPTYTPFQNGVSRDLNPDHFPELILPPPAADRQVLLLVFLI